MGPGAEASGGRPSRSSPHLVDTLDEPEHACAAFCEESLVPRECVFAFSDAGWEVRRSVEALVFVEVGVWMTPLAVSIWDI